MAERRGLWAHGDFLRLWAAQAVSAFGFRITRTGLPIIAVTTLDQPEVVVSVLMAIQIAPGLLVGLFAGGWIDRSRKRRILILSDLIRAVAIASLTLAWAVGALSVGHVLVTGAVVGAASALFQITDNTYLPSLIGRRQLGEGNAKLESTEAVAEITGPAVAGYLIRILGAPLAIVINAATYIWSAILLGRIRSTEPPSSEPAELHRMGEDLRTGFREVFRHPVVRPIVLSHMVWSLSGGFFLALYTLFCLRELRLSEGTFGVIVAMGGVGSLAGALISRALVRRLGLGHTLIATSVLSLTCALFIPLAGSSVTRGEHALIVGFLIAHQLLSDGFSVAFVIQAVTLRQTVLPRETLGRANAAIHVLTSGLLPVAAVIAGVIAEVAGTRFAVWVGVLVGMIAPLLLWPLRGLREMPPSASGELPAAPAERS
ncbi:MAG TPA: MFS transporter [Kofleriaceae bacterium]|nr:MFS transporter [Kofleriaceae bacterium]